ncbi:hypothetical protein [Candidatus Mycoplasma mahonii]|uniref:hypothetical protein n=1 Tax=Candidatus Mycoplasma mahonii TaxID=3004105 RepID=UPI0026F0253F|nr:hypothetical protein [Candidatus Mycoplasma mahonii]WKX02405.1 hypothetical protein O3I44_03360 [Candidatus Mycoplasma mahonii]
MAKEESLNSNPTIRQKLVGIEKKVSAKSISTWLSSEVKILSTEKEIRETQQVRFFIPIFIPLVQKESLVLEEAESIWWGEIELKNKLRTHNLTWWPISGQVLEDDNELLARFQEVFRVSATVIKDQNYFQAIIAQSKVVWTIKSIESVDTTAAHIGTLAEQGAKIKKLIDDAVMRIMKCADGVIQGGIDNADIAIATTPSVHKALNAHSNLAVRTDSAFAFAKYATSSSVQLDGLYDGIHEFKSTKQMIKAGLDFVVMVKGSAVSHLFINIMNKDKVGENAYWISLEFNEGTRIFFPQLITVGAKTATHTSQDAIDTTKKN